MGIASIIGISVIVTVTITLIILYLIKNNKKKTSDDDTPLIPFTKLMPNIPGVPNPTNPVVNDFLYTMERYMMRGSDNESKRVQYCGVRGGSGNICSGYWLSNRSDPGTPQIDPDRSKWFMFKPEDLHGNIHNYTGFDRAAVVVNDGDHVVLGTMVEDKLYVINICTNPPFVKGDDTNYNTDAGKCNSSASGTTDPSYQIIIQNINYVGSLDGLIFKVSGNKQGGNLSKTDVLQFDSVTPYVNPYVTNNQKHQYISLCTDTFKQYGVEPYIQCEGDSGSQNVQTSSIGDIDSTKFLFTIS